MEYEKWLDEIIEAVKKASAEQVTALLNLINQE